MAVVDLPPEDAVIIAYLIAREIERLGPSAPPFLRDIADRIEAVVRGESPPTDSVATP